MELFGMFDIVKKCRMIFVSPLLAFFIYKKNNLEKIVVII